MSVVQEIIIELFRTRSFINIWYLILLAVSWSITTYRTLGVGHYEAQMARRIGGRHMEEFELVAGNYCQRLADSFERHGTVSVLAISFALASLATLGFWFWYLFAQALFLLVAPLLLAGCITLAVARLQQRKPFKGEDLMRRYRRLRLTKQLIGVAAISGASMWGAIVTFKFPVV